jgi:phosphoserine phosphatase RsbU/P
VRIQLRIEPPAAPPFRGDYEGPEVVLGRSGQATVPIPDGSISRRHARLFEREGHWYIEDLGSRNATLLNGRVVSQPTRLQAQDEIRMAGTRVWVEGDLEPPASLDTEALSGILKPASPRLDLMSLRLLNEVHRTLARPITMEALLEVILDSAFTHFQPEEAAIFLRRGSGEVHRAASRRLPGAEGELFYSRRLIHEVAEKGQAALVEDPAQDQRFLGSESMLDLGPRNLLAAPLLDSEGSAGMIALHSRANRRLFTEEDLELLVSLASAAALRLHNIALAEETARRRLIDQELALAHEIQMGMLPKRFPERPEFEISARLRPARSVGGDLYDFLLVGDVSGKGVGAALFMAVTKTLFHAVVPGETSLAAVLARMNRELARDNERSMFVTAFMADLDLRTGELEYANAGHNLPYRLSTDGGVHEITGARGLPLGVFDERHYTTERLVLQPGEGLYLYTDGIVEALNSGGEEFTEERLRACLLSLRGSSPAELVAGTLATVGAFVGKAPQHDDITVLSLRYARSG